MQASTEIANLEKYFDMGKALYNKPILVVDNTKEEQSKNKTKKINSIARPKGEIELKNINYRISDGRYVGRKQINNIIITVYAKTQKECADKLKARLDEIYNLGTKKTIKNKYLYKNLFMQWFETEKKPFITKTAQSDIMLAFRNTAPFHELDIRKITKPAITALFSKMPENRSKEKARLYLNACLKYWQEEGVLSVNPCANVKVKKSHATKPAFTYEQQVAIIERLKGEPLGVIIRIYLVTGLRKNELNFTSIEKDIDLNNRILKAVNLKGRDMVRRYKQIKLSAKMISLIMNNLDIIHKYNAESAYREFAEVLKELKIEERSIVNCRHTFATNCFYLGKQDVLISREMGHSRTQITKDVYTDIDYHLDAEKIRKLYNNLYAEN